MQFKLTFEDGSDGYLKHFGVKGMHWGVWNDETRARRMGTSGRPSPKDYEKKLNNLDSKQRYNIKVLANLQATENSCMKKAAIAKSKGNVKKQREYERKQLAAANLKADIIQHNISVGEEYVRSMRDLLDSGYSFKTRELNYVQGGKVDEESFKKARSFVKQYGNMTIVSNASRGTNWKVKDSNKLSEKKKAKWNAHHDFYRAEPQRVDMYYV